MTNVKLKLTFFFLSAFITSDFIQARPQGQNLTEVLKNITKSNTTDVIYNIPVENDSDTLVVAKEQTVAQTNKNSNIAMEAIMNAEQDRDELILDRKKMKGSKILRISKEDSADFEKQMNVSSSQLDSMVNAEDRREESMTKILFKSEADFVDVPKYEFLVSGSKENDEKNSSVNDIDDKLGRNASDVFNKADYVELVAVERMDRGNKSDYSMENITVHDVDNDIAPDTILSVFSGFTDLQTLVFACAGTLLPLLAVLLATLCVRSLFRRLCPQYCGKRPASSASDSSEAKSEQQQPTTLNLQPVPEEPELLEANGTITTMTLKNNHLIVETEERNDIKRNGRETKLKYSPDNEGIFVVEVQQSTTYRPQCGSPRDSPRDSPQRDPQISTNQALIHRVPEDLELRLSRDVTLELEELEKNGNASRSLALSNTGLSISDLSMSSIGSHNASYSYGNQVGYEHGPLGYPVYAGYDTSKENFGCVIVQENSREPLIARTPTDPNKPVVTAAIFKQDSIIGPDTLQVSGYCMEGSSDGPLLSDVQARQASLLHLHDEMEKKLENGINNTHEEVELVEKNVLTRADTLPVDFEESIDGKVQQTNMMESIEEDALPAGIYKGKRASLPIIRTEMFESIKDTVIAIGSPKFEKLVDQPSPSDEEYVTPMITITEEVDVADDVDVS